MIWERECVCVRDGPGQPSPPHVQWSSTTRWLASHPNITLIMCTTQFSIIEQDKIVLTISPHLHHITSLYFMSYQFFLSCLSWRAIYPLSLYRLYSTLIYLVSVAKTQYKLPPQASKSTYVRICENILVNFNCRSYFAHEWLSNIHRTALYRTYVY